MTLSTSRVTIGRLDKPRAVTAGKTRLLTDRVLFVTQPGVIPIDLSEYEDGDYEVNFKCPGFNAESLKIVLRDGVAQKPSAVVSLSRRRWVVMRYAHNQRGRELSGPAVVEQRIKTAGGRPPDPFRNWLIRPGLTTTFYSHSNDRNCGFVVAPRGLIYEDLHIAPEFGYRSQNIVVRKGMLLFCHTRNYQSRELDNYAKILVEDIVEQPPEGVEVIDE